MSYAKHSRNRTLHEALAAAAAEVQRLSAACEAAGEQDEDAEQAWGEELDRYIDLKNAMLDAPIESRDDVVAKAAILSDLTATFCGPDIDAAIDRFVRNVATYEINRAAA